MKPRLILACLALLVLGGCAAPATGHIAGPYGAPGPSAPLSARPCPAPPDPVRSLLSEPFYTDGRFSNPDPARLAADTEASRPLRDWLWAIQRPAERWVALRQDAEADCALRLLEAWAEAGALLGSFNRQGGYHRKWTLGGAALAFLAVRDAPSATPERKARIGVWLAQVARQVQPVYDRPGPRNPDPAQASELRNNHVVWAGMAVAAAGVAAGDPALLAWGMGKGAVFLDAVTAEGAHPQEILRGRMALHYHLFALRSAAALARLGEAGGQPFDAARADALARFARFTYAATQDTARIAALAGEPQGHLTNPRPWLRDGLGFEIIRPRVAPPEALAPFRPYRSGWLGGNVTLLWGG